MCPWMDHDQLLAVESSLAALLAWQASKGLIFACTTVFCRRVYTAVHSSTGLPGTGSWITQNEKVDFQMLFQ